VVQPSAGRRAAAVSRRCLLALGVAALAACSSLPPGADFPRVSSTAFRQPGETRLGRAFAVLVDAHQADSGFRLIPVGVDGFALRMQLIQAAQSSLDLQYFIFRGDNTGSLLTAAILDCADRGVRVRILIDDGETVAGDERILALVAHPLIQVRIFNPFAYRGHLDLLRGIEYGLNFSRLDYRMHNKLLVADGALAVVGGRNLSDPYFQVNPEAQFADDDVVAVGPVVPRLSDVFDEFWNSGLSIPSEALSGGHSTVADLGPYRARLDAQRAEWKSQGADYLGKVKGGQPLADLVDGHLPLVWASVTVIYDSPDKRKVSEGEMVGRLMHRAVAQAAEAAQFELLMVTPYLIPGKEGMRIFTDLRKKEVRVRVLTTSLEANTVLLAQAGYMRYRRPLLEQGVELYEVRSQLGNARGSGESAKMAQFGNYGLHAKMFVFDRKRIFIGSMNFDQRSMHLNTEIGLLIDSAELAGQIATRFDAMVRLENAYTLVLRADADGAAPHLVWRTRENGADIEYDLEPQRKWGQRMGANLLSWLPIDDEL
jgi:putative cardiolipin synthase